MTSFPEMIVRLSPYAFSIALRMLGNEDEANDIVQESLIAVWQKIGRLKNPDGFKSWFYRIVVNRCYDRIRKMNQNPEIGFDERSWKKICETTGSDSAINLENEEMESHLV